MIHEQVGFNGGVPITEEFFIKHISGRHNPDIARDLFPNWTEEQQRAFYLDKEARCAGPPPCSAPKGGPPNAGPTLFDRYRRMAESRIHPIEGLLEFLDWMDAQGVRRVAVTNAPKENVEASEARWNAMLWLGLLHLEPRRWPLSLTPAASCPKVMLRGLGIAHRFEAVVFGEDCTRPKPFPDPYHEGLAIMGLTEEVSGLGKRSDSGALCFFGTAGSSFFL